MPSLPRFTYVGLAALAAVLSLTQALGPATALARDPARSGLIASRAIRLDRRAAPPEARRGAVASAPGWPTPGPGDGLASEASCAPFTSMGPVKVTARQISDWGDGATWEITVVNTDDETEVSGLELQILLPGARELEPWAMTFDVQLPMVRASLPEWLPSLPPGARHSFGFNVFPSAQPCNMRVASMDLGVFTPTPTETATPTLLEDSAAPPPSQGSSTGRTLPVRGQPSTAPLPIPGAPSPWLTSGDFAPPLSTSGRNIINADGEPVLLRGINWYGCETETYAVHGLWTRKWKDIMDQLAAEGFNLLRIPYSQDFLASGRKPSGIDFNLNPDLKDKTALQVLDKIVAYAGELEIYVTLDRHALRKNERTELWYTGTRTASSSSNPYGEAAWIEGLEQLAKRYADSPQVIGFDLHNEPHGRASWGTGETETDWRLAATRAGDRLLAINPALLILVEGVQSNVAGSDAASYWWGGNLSGVRLYPVQLSIPGRVVYSPHDYGPGVYPQSWFYASGFPANLPDVWRTYWAYIALEGRAPILVGEFGGWSVDPSQFAVGTDAWREAVWQQDIVDFMVDYGLSGTYWCLNPESFDTGGYLDADWRTVVAEKRRLLQTWVVR